MDSSVPTKLLEKILNIGNVDMTSQYGKYLCYWPVLLIGLIVSFIIIPLITLIKVLKFKAPKK